MAKCLKPKIQFDLKKELSDTVYRKGRRDERKDGEVAVIEENSVATEPCVEEIIRREELTGLLSKWDKLKRVKDMYEQQVVEKKKKCFRVRMVSHMKSRIAKMPEELRKLWLTKLLRLSFLNRLKRLKKLREERTMNLLEKLEDAKGPEREYLLSLLSELKTLYETKELDDVDELLEYKKAKKNVKTEKAKEMQMKIRLKRIKKMEELRLEEGRKYRQERVDKITNIVTVKKNWLEEMIVKIDRVTKQLVEELARLDNRQEWYLEMSRQLQQQKQIFFQDQQATIHQQQILLKLKQDMELEKIERKKKLEQLETWKKEKNIRLWKLEKVKQFDDFLENRQRLAEADENGAYKKIFKKLTASEKKATEVDPWVVKPKLDDLQKDAAKKKKVKDWIESMVSSTRHKAVKNIKLKKYLDMMDTEQLDNIFSQAHRMKTLRNIMIIVRGRILRNTFSDNEKKFFATAYGAIVKKAKSDLRDIRPTDQLVNIQLTTLHHDLYLTAGEEHLVIAMQIVPPREIPCKEDGETLCLTKDERNKLLQLIQDRHESRKVVKETRQKDYEAYQSRKALDDAWLIYMKKALAETDRDLGKCVKDQDLDRVDSEPERSAADSRPTNQFSTTKSSFGSSLSEKSDDALLETKFPAKRLEKQEQPKLSYGQAMKIREDRLIQLLRKQKRHLHETSSDKPLPPQPLHYLKQHVTFKEILKKEKTLRSFMDKDLPPDD